EEIDVPIGADNGFNVGAADQGQPTHFLPRRNRFIFRVKVPANFGEKDELIWTLTTHGKTEKAYATLRPDYIVDNVVKASETGALGAGTSSPETRSNQPPTVGIEEIKTRTVKVGETLTAVSVVKDDGLPKRRIPSREAIQRAQARAAEDPVLAAALKNPGMSQPTRITDGQNLRLHEAGVRYRSDGRRESHLRSAAGETVGGHARGRELAVGAGVGGRADSSGRQAAGERHLQRTGYLRPSLPGRRWRACRRRRGHDRRHTL